MKTPRISFLICTLNREHLFERAIRSLVNNELVNISFEIIVIDQGFSSKVKEICKDVNSIYVPSSPKGLSAARNIGSKYCNGEWVAFLDDDAYVSDNYFKSLNQILTSKKVNNLNAFSGRIMTIEDKSKPYIRFQTASSKSISYMNMDTILSSAFLVRKKSLDTVGWFDERFGIGARWGGSEEGDLTVRLINNSFNIYYFPSLIVYHPEDNFSEVILTEGSLGVSETSVNIKNNEILMIKPGEKAKVNYTNGEIKRTRVNTSLYTSWIDGRVAFRNESLPSMIQKLERIYNVVIINNNKDIVEKYFTATILYKEESINDVLSYLSEVYGLEYQIIDNKILIE